mmetsp:Transcript_29718/g.70738  ORF Transcript_29718/g.70738 Transcript_29718/m.70738 type:complete len:213 (+) Transcript_29718:1194-1832(+)
MVGRACDAPEVPCHSDDSAAALLSPQVGRVHQRIERRDNRLQERLERPRRVHVRFVEREEVCQRQVERRPVPLVPSVREERKGLCRVVLEQRSRHVQLQQDPRRSVLVRRAMHHGREHDQRLLDKLGVVRPDLEVGEHFAHQESEHFFVVAEADPLEDLCVYLSRDARRPASDDGSQELRNPGARRPDPLPHPVIRDVRVDVQEALLQLVHE